MSYADLNGADICSQYQIWLERVRFAAPNLLEIASPSLTVENFEFLNKVSSFSPLKIEEDHAPLKFSCVCTLCVNTTFPSDHHYPDHAEITVGYLEPFRF